MWKAFKLAFVCAVAGVSAYSVRAEEITLRVADLVPPTHFIARYGTHHFMDEVTKRTDGEVKFQYFPAEQLGKAKDMLSLLQSGLADIALVVPSYMSEKLPLSGVMDLPGGFNSSCEGTRTYARMLDADGWLAENEFSKAGVRKVFVYVNPPYELFLAHKNKRRLLDLAGAKIRSVGGATDLTVEALKGVPIRTSAPEVREALSRGTIDGMVFPVPTMLAYKLDSLVDSATRGARLASVATGYMISDRAWQKLSPKARDVIEEVGAETTRRVCEMTDADIAKTYETFAKEGVEVDDVGAQDVKALEPIYAEVRKNWAAQLDARGLPGSEALQAYDKASEETR